MENRSPLTETATCQAHDDGNMVMSHGHTPSHNACLLLPRDMARRVQKVGDVTQTHIISFHRIIAADAISETVNNGDGQSPASFTNRSAIRQQVRVVTITAMTQPPGHTCTGADPMTVRSPAATPARSETEHPTEAKKIPAGLGRQCRHKHADIDNSVRPAVASGPSNVNSDKTKTICSSKSNKG